MSRLRTHAGAAQLWQPGPRDGSPAELVRRVKLPALALGSPSDEDKARKLLGETWWHMCHEVNRRGGPDSMSLWAPMPTIVAPAVLLLRVYRSSCRTRGAHSGLFREEVEARLVAEVRDAGPDGVECAGYLKAAPRTFNPDMVRRYVAALVSRGYLCRRLGERRVRHPDHVEAQPRERSW